MGTDSRRAVRLAGMAAMLLGIAGIGAFAISGGTVALLAAVAVLALGVAMAMLATSDRGGETRPSNDIGAVERYASRRMARPTDCIYCSADTGSREHTFPAGLGGRRVNKGILCAECNGKFSPLDGLLVEQLRQINGLIGVRGDHADEPHLARGASGDDSLRIDATGKPSYAAPRELSNEARADGTRQISMEFANDNEARAWIEEQRKLGNGVQTIERREGARYASAPVEMSWSFGGNDAFREIGRVALNFLAHQWPEVARNPDLAPFKAYVEGKRVLDDGERRHVWYAGRDAAALPPSEFAFGHRVLLWFVRGGDAFARVSFFGVFDLCVWFGTLRNVPAECVLFDIDPLAEHPPKDLRVGRQAEPKPLTPPTSDALDLAPVFQAAMNDLLRRVSDRQWTLGTDGLLDEINGAGRLEPGARLLHVAAVLMPHAARALRMGRVFSDKLSSQEPADETAARIAAIVASDAESEDGLTADGRAFLPQAVDALATRLVADVASGPITDERLRLLLEGGPGVAVVGAVLCRIVGVHVR